MNDFGKFLYVLRKEKGMTQAELAKALGVTNKAVSKWETGESMPDTSLLLPISKLFGVSVDELLKGKRNSDDIAASEDENSSKEKQKEMFDFDEAKKHIFTRGKDDEKDKFLLDKICGAFCASVILLGVLSYLILGIVLNEWSPYWVIVPICALSCGIIGIVFDFCNASKRKRKLEQGENPYIGGICGLIMLSCIIVYLLVGVFVGFWHPYWIMIVVGTVLCALIGSIGSIFSHKKKE